MFVGREFHSDVHSIGDDGDSSLQGKAANHFGGRTVGRDRDCFSMVDESGSGAADSALLAGQWFNVGPERAVISERLMEELRNGTAPLGAPQKALLFQKFKITTYRDHGNTEPEAEVIDSDRSALLQRPENELKSLRLFVSRGFGRWIRHP